MMTSTKIEDDLKKMEDNLKNEMEDDLKKKGKTTSKKMKIEDNLIFFEKLELWTQKKWKTT